MPLVVICGRPGTGKTAFARALSEYIVATGVASANVTVVNDETLGTVDRAGGYASSTSEKTVRATLKSAVERLLSKDRVVIADGLNYIKGYRYELYCIVRAVGTTHACVWVDSPQASAEARNSARAQAAAARHEGHPGDLVAGSYSGKVFEDLWLRFEPPDPRNRWDAPMIRVPGAPSAAPEHEDAGGVGGQTSDPHGAAAQGARLAPAFTSKFIGTVVSTPAALSAAEAQAGSVAPCCPSPCQWEERPPPLAPEAPAPTQPASAKKSAFKRAAPAVALPDAMAPAAGRDCSSPDSSSDQFFDGNDPPPADALYCTPGGDDDDRDIGVLDALDGPMGGDATEDADVEAARTRLAALRAVAAGKEGEGEGDERGGRGSRRGEGVDGVSVPSCSTERARAFLETLPRPWHGPMQRIVTALFARKGYTAPLSTRAVAALPGQYIQEVDVRTGAVVEHVVAQLVALAGQVGDAIIPVPGSAVPFAVRRRVTPLELRRLKREFERLAASSSADASGGVDAISTRFVSFMNGHLRNG